MIIQTNTVVVPVVPARRLLCLRGVWDLDCRSDGVATDDLNIAQHDQMSVRLEVVDNAGNPVSLFGVPEIAWTVARDLYNPPLVTKRLSAGDGYIIADNIWDFPLTSADTAFFLRSLLYHEAKIINSAGDQSTILRGKISVTDTRISD